MNGQQCTECPRGKWKLAGNDTSCNSCPGNQTTLNNATQSEAQCGKASFPVVDPGFPIGGGHQPVGGGADLQCVHFLAKTYVKMKEIDPVGGHMPAAPPLDPAMVSRDIVVNNVT